MCIKFKFARLHFLKVHTFNLSTYVAPFYISSMGGYSSFELFAVQRDVKTNSLLLLFYPAIGNLNISISYLDICLSPLQSIYLHTLCDFGQFIKCLCVLVKSFGYLI